MLSSVKEKDEPLNSLLRTLTSVIPFKWVKKRSKSTKKTLWFDAFPRLRMSVVLVKSASSLRPKRSGFSRGTENSTPGPTVAETGVGSRLLTFHTLHWGQNWKIPA